MELLLPILTGIFSFVGSYCALRVHVDYLRRDVDLAHRRIDHLQGIKS